MKDENRNDSRYVRPYVNFLAVVRAVSWPTEEPMRISCIRRWYFPPSGFATGL